MISILVTYYNQQQYVSRSLDSIFTQKLSEDFEVLVGDDGSQDETCKKVNEYICKYPGIIKLNVQPRDLNEKYNPVQRASKNRLDLLKMAKGDFVCFLDGDDEYCDFNWLQESVDILKQNKKIVGVAHNFKETYEDGKEDYPEGIYDIKYVTAKMYCRKLYTPAGTILFRNIFSKKEYDKLISLKSFDDNDITFYFLNFGDLYCENKVVYNYYQNLGSIWNSTNSVEKALINSIDFEIIKKMLNKYHVILLNKFFPSILTVYKARSELSNTKFAKYKEQCIPLGFSDNLLNWKNISVFKKFSVHLKFLFYMFVFCFFRFCDKLTK